MKVHTDKPLRRCIAPIYNLILNIYYAWRQTNRDKTAKLQEKLIHCNPSPHTTLYDQDVLTSIAVPTSPKAIAF